MSERLMAALDGARWCQYDADGLLYAWFGGHGVHGYDAAGNEVTFWNTGSFADNEATLEQVRESIAAHLVEQASR